MTSRLGLKIQGLGLGAVTTTTVFIYNGGLDVPSAVTMVAIGVIFTAYGGYLDIRRNDDE